MRNREDLSPQENEMVDKRVQSGLVSYDDALRQLGVVIPIDPRILKELGRDDSAIVSPVAAARRRVIELPSRARGQNHPNDQPLTLSEQRDIQNSYSDEERAIALEGLKLSRAALRQTDNH